MRSPFAYTPRPRPLQAASPAPRSPTSAPWSSVAFLYSSPLVLVAAGVAVSLAGLLAGARRGGARGAADGPDPGAPDRRRQRPRRQPRRDGAGAARRLAAAGPGRRHRRGARRPASSIGLRAAVAMVAFAVYSACVDPDRVLRALRPLAGRSALTATLVSRLVPVAAADAARLRDAAPPARPGRRRGRPGAAGPAPARRLARPRRRRRRDARAARLRPRAALRPRSRDATRPGAALALRPPLLRRRRGRARRRDRRQGCSAPTLPHLPDDRARPRRRRRSRSRRCSSSAAWRRCGAGRGDRAGAYDPVRRAPPRGRARPALEAPRV